ncbi:hypothetical protein [Calothrix sp. CCY 0018]|uniref:hypothetical protein n=1 Tax=Calothrix sp. CCY 0018 TaxID=3103864 RepID=UPI0039C6FCBD
MRSRLDTPTWLRDFKQACLAVQECPTSLVSSAPSHFGVRRQSASIADGIHWSSYPGW